MCSPAKSPHADPREDSLYRVSLCTNVRLRALLAFNVGDVTPDGRKFLYRVSLDLTTTKGGRRGEVFLPARLIPKLRRFLAWKHTHGESVEPRAALDLIIVQLDV